MNFSITFDKDKIHELFYEKGILYSKFTDKELFILPILIKNNEIFIFSNNFFYENWNKVNEVDLIEFILPQENIEIIQNINKNKKNLIKLNLNNLFKEYPKNNLAIILIEDNNSNNIKIYLNQKFKKKIFLKALNFKKKNLIKRIL